MTALIEKQRVQRRKRFAPVRLKRIESRPVRLLSRPGFLPGGSRRPRRARFRKPIQVPRSWARAVRTRLAAFSDALRSLEHASYYAAIVLFVLILGMLPTGFLASGPSLPQGGLGLPDDPGIEMALYGFGEEESTDAVLPESVNLDPIVLSSLEVATVTVSPGDTISEIAQQYLLELDTILSFNGIQNVHRLQVGKQLKIPNLDGVMHTVRRGDSLSSIAQGFGVSVNTILDVNNLQSDVIQPGDELFVPGGRMNDIERKRILGELFVYPTRGRLTSRYGWRISPFTGIRSFHNGVDLANAVGTPVWASMEGVVKSVGYNQAYGNYIILNHRGGYQTLYGHMDTVSVKTGQRVAQRRRLGTMGNTGYSTGSHLHFSIYRWGSTLDPYNGLLH
jgi:LysM repeat protein